jgi:sugar lactone lactonase YvrE
MRLLLAALLLAVLPAVAQQDAGNARRTIAAVEKLLQQRPADATLWFFLARSHARLGDAAACVAALEKVNELGDGFLPPRGDFARVWEDTAFQAVRRKLEARLPTLDYAPTAFEIDDRALMPEGIAYDAPSRSFFIGSVHRRVLRLGADPGAATEFAGTGAGLDAVLGLAVDAPRRILYAVSTSALTTEGRRNRRNAVVAFDIDSRKLLHRHDVPGAMQLNDVAVALGGRVFASDSASGAVYEIAVKGPGPARELLAPGRVGGANGLAASPGGDRLYVAHSTGLAVIDIADGSVKRVDNRTRETVAAIDGLYQWQGQLIGVQNVTTPGRVILMTLSPAGDAVTRVTTMLSHHHNALDEPTTGAVAGDNFYLLAATGISRFNADGRIDDPESAPTPRVVRIPLPR